MSIPTDGGQGAPAAESAGVQPTDGAEAQPTPEPSGGGQDFIAPYLEGVDGPIRDVVAEKLEAYRRDADANFTRRFQQVQEQLQAYQQYGDPDQLQIPVRLYDSLIQDPVGTLEWVIGQFREAGQDVTGQLLERLGGAQPQAPQQPQQPATNGQQPADDANRPLTMADLQAWQQQQQQQLELRQREEQAKQQVNQWLDEAAQTAGLELGQDDLVLRNAILMHAQQLMAQGQRDGRKAIGMAVEAVVNRFKTKPQASAPEPTPRVATGGGPAQVRKDINWNDSRARREAMLAMLGTQE